MRGKVPPRARANVNATGAPASAILAGHGSQIPTAPRRRRVGFTRRCPRDGVRTRDLPQRAPRERRLGLLTGGEAARARGRVHLPLHLSHAPGARLSPLSGAVANATLRGRLVPERRVPRNGPCVDLGGVLRWSPSPGRRIRALLRSALYSLDHHAPGERGRGGADPREPDAPLYRAVSWLLLRAHIRGGA